MVKAILRRALSTISSGTGRQSSRARDGSKFTALALATAVCLAWIGRSAAAAAGAREDVQQIGLAPLYEVLFAVANCPNVALDEPAFRRAARLYHLSTIDLKIDGPFSAEIAGLANDYRIRLEDDRAAFCSVNRLQFAVPYGVLIDRGPVVPHPPPFAIAPD